MAASLSPEDLFHLAERVERRGAEFYRQAAEACPDSAGRQLLEGLAEMEKTHEQIFAAIRQHVLKLKAPRATSPQGAARFRIVFDVLLGGLMKDLHLRFLGKSSTGDILAEAIAFEKDTIVFLAQLADTLEQPSDKKKVQAILREELSHVFELSSQLAGERPGSGSSAFLQANA
jgi:rubrerythrin